MTVTRVSAVVLCVLFGALSHNGQLLAVQAAVPPLSKKDLFLYADHIFTGTVDTIEHVDVPNQHYPETWINRHWRCNVTVRKVYKTGVNPHESPPHGHDDETMVDGQSIHLMLWKAWKRPDGTVGNAGVSKLPDVGQTYSFFTRYLHRDPQQRNMYHESFPHEEEDSELAAQEAAAEKAGLPTPPGPRKTTHTKAYNALTPNGIEDVYFLEMMEEL